MAPRARRKQRASRPGSSSEAPASPRVPRRRPSNMRPTTRPTSTKRRPSLTFRGGRGGGVRERLAGSAASSGCRLALSTLWAPRGKSAPHRGGELGARCELRARCASWRRSWRRVAPCPSADRGARRLHGVHLSPVARGAGATEVRRRGLGGAAGHRRAADGMHHLLGLLLQRSLRRRGGDAAVRHGAARRRHGIRGGTLFDRPPPPPPRHPSPGATAPAPRASERR